LGCSMICSAIASPISSFQQAGTARHQGKEPRAWRIQTRPTPTLQQPAFCVR
jgi:hypothetical protein